MNRSLLSTLIGTISFAALCAACTTTNQFLLPGDGGGDAEGGGGSSDGAGSSTGGSSDGGSTGTSNPQGGAKDFFVKTVFPSLSTTCNSCHDDPDNTTGAPQFLGDNGNAAYTAIEGYTPALIAIPENSLLIQHGAHTGPALETDQIDIVSEWLQMEADERGLTGGGEDPPSGPTLQEALQGFADCMSYDDWMATGMNTIATTQTQYGNCNSCHASGEAGAWLSLNDQQMFEMNRQFPYIKRLVSGTVDEQGAFAGLVAARRFQNKGLEAESCNEQIDNCHPVFSLPPAKSQAIDDFVSLTIQKYEDGGCTPQP